MSAPDIFLSYNREDAARARHFADGFAAEGLDVWWDVALRSGEAYDKVTEDALRDDKAVVVLWSPRSVESRWVRAEATLADRKRTLMPAMIEPCERPIMFELVQTADLSHWKGNTSDKAWQDFARHVADFVGEAKTAASVPSVVGEAAQLHNLDRISVVVLPFANMSRDEEQEYFADGITEDIITDLSKVSSLDVISRNSAFTFKGKPVNIPDVARQLNVTHVIEGSVRKAGTRVRVTAQLIDGSTNNHVWAERYDRDLKDIFGLQDELSRAIVGAMKISLLPQEEATLSDRGTTSTQAYDLFARARALQLGYGFDDTKIAIGLFQQAVRIDPAFGQAWCSLAHALSNALLFASDDIEDNWNKALVALRRGSALLCDSWEPTAAALNIAAWEYEWDSVAALINRKVSLPFDSGYYHALLGRVEEGCRRQLEHVKNDPLSSGRSFMMQLHFDAAGKLDDAEAEYQRGKQLTGPKGSMEWRALTRAICRGDDDRVRDLFLNCEMEAVAKPYQAQIMSALDSPETAAVVLRDLVARPEFQVGLHHDAFASWAVYFGETDLAFEALRRGYVDRKGGPGLFNFWMPIYAELRRDERFKELLVEVGIVDFWRRSGNWGDFARPLGDDDFEIIR